MPRASLRGGPLISLGAILCLWIVARVAFASYEAQAGHERFVPLPVAAVEASLPLRIAPLEKRAAASPPAFAPLSAPSSPRIAPAPSRWDRPPSLPQPVAARIPVGVAAGHNVLWMAALAKLPFPAGLAAMRQAVPAPVPFYPADRAKRWSADGWLLLRPGGANALAAGAAPATYGASQMGAVVRYRIAPHSGHRPEAYMRAAAALGGVADKELAIGVSARPVPGLPLRAMVELRASDPPLGQQFRPAAMIVTEVQPIDLPHGARAEFYGQAGYAGGRFATAFADGQARVDTRIANLGDGELRAGAGAWAGAQHGASRVDLGPTATLGVPIGQTGSARLALDWRMRVAGNAEPGSGPALTPSAGF